MAMGAIPVQTLTTCCDEWFGDSEADVRRVTVSLVKKATKQDLVLVRGPAGSEVVQSRKSSLASKTSFRAAKRMLGHDSAKNSAN